VETRGFESEGDSVGMTSLELYFNSSISVWELAYGGLAIVCLGTGSLYGRLRNWSAYAAG
jgi:hypothetical protein